MPEGGAAAEPGPSSPVPAPAAGPRPYGPATRPRRAAPCPGPERAPAELAHLPERRWLARGRVARLLHEAPSAEPVRGPERAPAGLARLAEKRRPACGCAARPPHEPPSVEPVPAGLGRLLAFLGSGSSVPPVESPRKHRGLPVSQNRLCRCVQEIYASASSGVNSENKCRNKRQGLGRPQTGTSGWWTPSHGSALGVELEPSL